jgi:YHS domain-containing protein
VIQVTDRTPAVIIPAVIIYEGIRPATITGTPDHVRRSGRFAPWFRRDGFCRDRPIDNMCAEGLALGKDIKTDCSVNATIDGKAYRFGNEQAKTDFMKDPKGNLAKAQSHYSSKHPG